LPLIGPTRSISLRASVCMSLNVSSSRPLLCRSTQRTSSSPIGQLFHSFKLCKLVKLFSKDIPQFASVDRDLRRCSSKTLFLIHGTLPDRWQAPVRGEPFGNVLDSRDYSLRTPRHCLGDKRIRIEDQGQSLQSSEEFDRGFGTKNGAWVAGINTSHDYFPSFDW
jgi:hypothetical protein